MPFAKPISALLKGVSGNKCCCNPPVCTLYYQKKSGTATLYGYDEFTTPSSPPKKYRKRTYSGWLQTCTLGNGGVCPSYRDGIHNWGLVFDSYYSGSKDYDLAGNWSDNTTVMQGNAAPANQCGGSAIYTNTGAVGGGPGGTIVQGVGNPYLNVNLTNTSRYQGGNGQCSPIGIMGTYPEYVQKNTNREDLSIEYTEDTAITQNNNIIGAWTGCLTSCTAYKALRAAATFTMGYQTMQWQVGLSSGTVGKSYSVTVQYQKRLYGTTNPFVDWAQDATTLTMTSDPYRDAQWFTFPVESGYEVQISNCIVAAL